MPTLLYSVPLTPQQAIVDSCLRWRLLDTHRQVWVSCEDIAPFSWCTQGFVCALQESISPVLWNFYNQIPVAFRKSNKFPGDFQCLCQIHRLGNLLWALELSQQCQKFFGIIALQFVGCLLRGCTVGLMVQEGLCQRLCD